VITVHGPKDPALAGTTYRLQARNLSAGTAFAPVTSSFYVSDLDGNQVLITPAANGQLAWPQWQTNTRGQLGLVPTSGDDLWEIRLEVGPGFAPVQTQRTQLDNTLSAASLDPLNSAHLTVDPGQLAEQACGKFTQGMVVHGTFDAHDTNFREWSLGLATGSNVVIPAGLLSTGPTDHTSEVPVGSTWQLDTGGLTPCGYLLRLAVFDRVVQDSSFLGRHNVVDIGFCVDAP
jgi:hypothetical protein